jgi:hypothetical protein
MCDLVKYICHHDFVFLMKINLVACLQLILLQDMSAAQP